MKTRITATLAATTLLAACGGGGGGSDSGSATAEGFWVGTSDGYAVALAVLEDGQSWGLVTSPTAIVSALYGTTKSRDGSLSGSGSEFYFPASTLQSATYAGNYSPKQTIKITTSPESSISGTYVPEYDVPASLTAAAGSYTGVGISAASTAFETSLSIAPDGALSATTPLCSGSGTMQPRASGKGIFNVTLTFTGADCPFAAAGTSAGVAFYDSSRRALVTMGLNTGKTDGFFWVGSKQ